MVGRSSWTSRIRSGLSKACSGRPGRCPKSKSNRYCGVRSIDQQSAMGRRLRECVSFRQASRVSPKDWVANVSQVVTLDKDLLTDPVGKLPRAKLSLLLAGIDVILGR